MSVPVVVNYSTLGQVRQRFLQIGNDVAQVSKRIAVQAQELRDNGWEGEGSDAFYAELADEVMPALLRLVQAMGEASNAVERMARIFRDAETASQSSFGGPE